MVRYLLIASVPKVLILCVFELIVLGKCSDPYISHQVKCSLIKCDM